MGCVGVKPPALEATHTHTHTGNLSLYLYFCLSSRLITEHFLCPSLHFPEGVIDSQTLNTDTLTATAQPLWNVCKLWGLCGCVFKTVLVMSRTRRVTLCCDWRLKKADKLGPVAAAEECGCGAAFREKKLKLRGYYLGEQFKGLLHEKIVLPLLNCFLLVLSFENIISC